MSVGSVILPFTHWPIAYQQDQKIGATAAARLADRDDHATASITKDPIAAAATAAKSLSDTVLTCSTGFSSGVILGLASGAIEILQWDANVTDSGGSTIMLAPLSTTAGHRQSPVVALRRIAAKNTDGRSELLISAAENGEILKHSLPSGKVLNSATVPFRPTGIVSVDKFLIIYGRSSEIQILHQSNLEQHIILPAALSYWPIPFSLFAERIVTLDENGIGQHWKIWPEEARLERITNVGTPVSFGSPIARAGFRDVERIRLFDRVRRMSKNSKFAANVQLGEREYGSIQAVQNVNDITWLVVQDSGWSLYKWEEDQFVQFQKESFANIKGAATNDVIQDDSNQNWFTIWDKFGKVKFGIVKKLEGRLRCQLCEIEPSPKPKNVQTLSMAVSFSFKLSTMSRVSVQNVLSSMEVNNVLVDFFYSEGEIKYWIADLQSLKWHEQSFPIYRPHHFFRRLKPRPSFAYSTLNGDHHDPAAVPVQHASPQSLTSVSKTTNSTSGPCHTETVFAGWLVFSCGPYVNAYTLSRYLLAFNFPNKSIQVPEEPESNVTLLVSVQASDAIEYLLIGTSLGTLYILKSNDWKLSNRIALFGAPVFYSMIFKAKDTSLNRDFIVVTSKDGTVCVIDLQKLRKLFTIPGHFFRIHSLAIPKNSKILVVIYEDRSAKICNLDDGKLENQAEVFINEEENWVISHVEVRPRIPDDQLVYTDSRYTLNGSSTVFLNINAILEGIQHNDTSSILNAKAALSALYSWSAFECHESPADASVVDSSELINLLFLKSSEVLQGDAVTLAQQAAWSVPAKLGARGIANTLTVFHAHQDILQISGEITSMVFVSCVVLATALLRIQLSTDNLKVGNNDQEKNKKSMDLVDRYMEKFVSVLFAGSDGKEGKQFKRPWLRVFARYWAEENPSLRSAARVCIIACIKQLSRSPKELSRTISRWRILLPTTTTASATTPPPTPSLQSTMPSGSKKEESRTVLQRMSSQESEPSILNDDGLDDLTDALSSTIMQNNSSEPNSCDHAMYEAAALSTVILGNIAIACRDTISHAAHREIAGAVQQLLLKNHGDGDSNCASTNSVDAAVEDNKQTRQLQDIGIELAGFGWHVWGDGNYFAIDVVLRRMVEFFGSDPVPMPAMTSSTAAGDKNKISIASTSALAPLLTALDMRRHELLLTSGMIMVTASTNRVVEICAETILSSLDARSRIGAVRFMNHVVQVAPELIIDRLYPVIDATISTLDPSSINMRNKVVNSITSLYNSLVNTFPVVASHRAQQRLALSMKPDLLLVYDLRTGTQLASLVGAHNQCMNIQFSPEGRHVLGIDRVTSQVYIWKLGHSFLSMIQSIGGGPVHEKSLLSASASATFLTHANGEAVDVSRRDLVYPRFVGKLLSGSRFAFAELNRENKFISTIWKSEKIVEISVNDITETFDFTNT
ncbi:hypothetical protein V1514DRAFT_197064 [Lipomyces japonicus]|uniref:uncharacterized protein n=1 Tax=Lipomyces japonicus TaxID=56871 RepID=UPI0034CEBC34